MIGAIILPPATPRTLARRAPWPQDAAMKATHDTTTFTLTGKVWSATYPLETLPGWLAFYRGRAERFPQSRASYDATVAALEQLEQALSGRK